MGMENVTDSSASASVMQGTTEEALRLHHMLVFVRISCARTAALAMASATLRQEAASAQMGSPGMTVPLKQNGLVR